VNPIPTASEYGFGRRSVYAPTTGCSSDAVSWNVNVISPISANDSLYASLSTGYNAGSSAWIVSFSMCEKLSASSTGTAVAGTAGAGAVVAAAATGSAAAVAAGTGGASPVGTSSTISVISASVMVGSGPVDRIGLKGGR
jgi:hypothetical protein